MMPHPTIVTVNGQLRHKALLKDAELERYLQEGKPNKSVVQRVIAAVRAIEVQPQPPQPQPTASMKAR